MAELVARCTGMPVVQVQQDTPIEANRVYCIPPGKYLGIRDGILRTTVPSETDGVRLPIDAFFDTLAADVGENAVGIVLSGTGSDGSLGLGAIKRAGGLALAQDPSTAGHDGMPRSAIAARVVDRVASPAEMPGILFEYLRHRAGGEPGSPLAEGMTDGLEAVLTLLGERMGFDFRSYKRSTLARRLARRMDLQHLTDVADYLRLLTEQPVEATRLFDDLLIGVTSFFRDPGMWEELRERVIRPLVARHDAARPIRVWVPGCATGEEAYSIAMLLLEEMQAARMEASPLIFASDVDRVALEVARAGFYPERIAATLPPERRRRFFVDDGAGAHASKELRESVVFGRQNLLLDPPYSKLDLISCRNVLMYCQPAAQRHILPLLHFALVDGGHLVLGTGEGMGKDADLFQVASAKWKIFRRVGPTRYDRVRFPGVTETAASRSARGQVGTPRIGQFTVLARQLLLDRFAPPCVLINRRYEILYFAGATNDFLLQPIGVPSHDLMARVRHGLRTKLRSAIRGTFKDGRRRVVEGALTRRADAVQQVRVTVEPLVIVRDTDGVLLVSFADGPGAAVATTRDVSMTTPSRPGISRRRLEDELRTTQEDLQGTISELEGSNLELKVANDEILSVNEELRSSNEELETSKEELHSLNEELNTVNTQLEDKVGQLRQANNDLDSLLTSTNIATIFCDTMFRVRRFTPMAARLFDLLPSDAGRPIGDLAQRYEPDLLHDAEQVLATQVPISKEVRHRDGRWFIRQTLPYRTHEERDAGIVITYSDVAADVLSEARLYAEAIVDAVRDPLLVLDADLRVQSANRAFYEAFARAPDATVGRFAYSLSHYDQGPPALPTLATAMLRNGTPLENVEVESDGGPNGRRTLLLNTRALARGGGRPDLVLLSIEDVTERKRTERILRESEAMTRAGVRTAVDGIITFDERGSVLSCNPAAEQIFGYADGDVIGQSVGLLVPEPDDPVGEESYLPTRDPRLLGIGHEVRGRRKDGTIFPLDIHVSAFDDSGCRRFVGTLRDISERKRAEERGRRHQAELAHVLRVATIEHLASGLAHELNQPLAAIANEIEACATYVRAGTQQPTRLLASLEHAGAEALRAGGIVHHLREFVQRKPPNLELMDLSVIARNAIQWFVREMEQSRITVRLDLAKTALWVVVDRIQIEQVLVNLLRNAFDAIRETDHETGEIRIRTSRTEDTAEVAIDDSGVGLSPGVAERLYEAYYTTKPDGMGLGLAISRSIVETHNGRLDVAPRAGTSGTTVCMTLPIGGTQVTGTTS
jgi:two-component system, chemotaxis family, CheB/CheR fusion protein